MFSINSDECTIGCQTILEMRVLQSNVSNQSLVGNVTVFESGQAFVLTGSISDGHDIINRVQRILVNTATTGLYVAIRDTGTCVGVSEVTVFYPVCDHVSLDLGANFTVTRFSDETASGTCFDNMAINIDVPDESFSATCTLEIVRDVGTMPTEIITSWTINGDSRRCMCLPGYEFISNISTSQCQGMCV